MTTDSAPAPSKSWRRRRWAVVSAAAALAALVMLLRLHSVGPRLEMVSYILSDTDADAMYVVQVEVRGGGTVDRIEMLPRGDETILGRTSVEDFASGSVWTPRVVVPRDESGRADGGVLVRMSGPESREYEYALVDGPPRAREERP